MGIKIVEEHGKTPGLRNWRVKGIYKDNSQAIYQPVSISNPDGHYYLAWIGDKGDICLSTAFNWEACVDAAGWMTLRAYVKPESEEEEEEDE